MNRIKSEDILCKTHQWEVIHAVEIGEIIEVRCKDCFMNGYVINHSQSEWQKALGTTLDTRYDWHRPETVCHRIPEKTMNETFKDPEDYQSVIELENHRLIVHDEDGKWKFEAAAHTSCDHKWTISGISYDPDTIHVNCETCAEYGYVEYFNEDEWHRAKYRNILEIDRFHDAEKVVIPKPKARQDVQIRDGILKDYSGVEILQLLKHVAPPAYHPSIDEWVRHIVEIKS